MSHLHLPCSAQPSPLDFGPTHLYQGYVGGFRRDIDSLTTLKRDANQYDVSDHSAMK